MKAVIMAGGSGTRLRPLTCKTPKPMAEIATEAAMCHIIRLLKRCGVDSAAVTTMYLADKVRALGDEYEGVKLTYYHENSPLGTAGSVKRAAVGFDEDFIVISGDCICDFELERVVDFHRTVNADCTVALARRADPSEYGVVLCGNDGKILRFIEKPAWSQIFSDCVNTGIYIINPKILHLVPDGVSYDFAKELFPRLLGGRLYGCEVEGYWCDVGSVRDYYRCNFDAARGKVGGIQKIPLCGGSIIGRDCRIEGEAKDSILQSGVIVGKNSRLDGCIVCAGSTIGRNVTLGHGAVIGGDCVIEDDCVIGEGVKIYADVKIPRGSVVMHDVTNKNEFSALFTDSGIYGKISGALSPERCLLLGSACVIRRGARVGVMCREDGAAVQELIKSCLLAGVARGGGVPLELGEGSRPMSCYAALAYRLDIALYIDCDGESVKIYPVGGDSLTLCGETERKIKAALDTSAKSGDYTEKTVKISGVRELYVSALARSRSNMKGLECAVSDTPAGSVLAEALNILGADVRLCSPSELNAAKADRRLCFEIDDESLRMYVGGNFSADFEHIRACLVHHKAPAYKNIALPYCAPSVLDGIAYRRGARVFRYLTTPTGGGDIGARSVAADFGQLIFRDVCFMAMQMCELYAEMSFETDKLKALFRELPQFSRDTRDIEYEDDKRAELMRRIVTSPTASAEGAQLIFRGGRALVIPRRSGGFRIIAEAVSTEAAREISFKTERKLYGKEEE